MRDFFTAAFPWIIVGLCVAILAVRIGGKRLRRKDGGQDANPHGNYGTEGMCLGMCLGVAIETALGKQTGLGLSLGMLLGLALGICIKKEK